MSQPRLPLSEKLATRYRRFCLAMLICFLGGEMPWAVSAEVPNDIGSGQIIFQAVSDQSNDDSIVSNLRAIHLGTVATISISGFVAQIELTEEFKNQSDEWREAVYLFPLSETAAVNGMEIRLGERIIRAEIKEKEQAGKIYQQAKQAGKRAALTEQSRANLFRQKIANIAPHETITVTLSVAQRVDYDAGVFSLRFPMTITPRYLPGKPLTTGMIDGDAWMSERSSAENNVDGSAPPTKQKPIEILTTAYTDSARSGYVINPIAINVKLNADFSLREVASLYHEVSVKRAGENYLISFIDDRVSMGRDYVLKWRPALGVQPQAALFRETIDTEDYLLLMMLPPDGSLPVPPMPRDMVFVLDTSGSMQGSSMTQARSSLQRALAGLRPEDRFNIIEFNDTATTLFTSMRSADSYTVERGSQWVAGLKAGGGTNMFRALEVATSLPMSEEYLTHIIFITDGAVGNENNFFG